MIVTLNATAKTITTEWNEEYVDETGNVVSCDMTQTVSYRNNFKELTMFLYGRRMVGKQGNPATDRYIITR